MTPSHPAAPRPQCRRDRARMPPLIEAAASSNQAPRRCRFRPVWLSFLVMPSMRSAAALNAATMAAWVACARSRRDHARILQGGDLLFELALLAAGFRQFVGDSERRHHGQAGVADLAEGAAQMVDALVEQLGELHQMALLPVFAGHPVLPAVDGDIHLRHREPLTLSDRAHSITGADALDRHIQAARDFAVGGLELARMRGRVIEIGGSRERSAPSACNCGQRAFLRRGRPRAGARPRPQARQAPEPGARVAASIALGIGHRIAASGSKNACNAQGFRLRSLSAQV